MKKTLVFILVLAFILAFTANTNADPPKTSVSMLDTDDHPWGGEEELQDTPWVEPSSSLSSLEVWLSIVSPM